MIFFPFIVLFQIISALGSNISLNILRIPRIFQDLGISQDHVIPIIEFLYSQEFLGIPWMRSNPGNSQDYLRILLKYLSNYRGPGISRNFQDPGFSRMINNPRKSQDFHVFQEKPGISRCPITASQDLEILRISQDLFQEFFLGFLEIIPGNSQEILQGSSAKRSSIAKTS